MTNQNNFNLEELIKKMYDRSTDTASQKARKRHVALSMIMGMPFAAAGFVIGLFRIAVQFMLLAVARILVTFIKVAVTAFDATVTSVWILGWLLYVHLHEMTGNLVFHLKHFNDHDYGCRRNRIGRLLWPELAESDRINECVEQMNAIIQKMEKKRADIRKKTGYHTEQNMEQTPEWETNLLERKLN